MWRKWAVCVLLPMLFAVTGMADGLHGEWSATFSLLPDVGLEATSLTLGYELGSWSVSGTAQFLGTDGYVWQSFGLAGPLGFADFEWEVLFGPLAPVFLYTWGSLGMQFFGLDLTLASALVGPDVPGYFFSGGPSGGVVAVLESQIGGMSLRSATGFGARLLDVDQGDSFSIVYIGDATYTWGFPIDPFPGGSAFSYQELSLTGVPVCCDITCDFELSFLKEGFDYFEFYCANLFGLFDVVTFDVSFRYGVDYKTVAVTPKFPEFGLVGCVEMFGDVLWDQEEEPAPGDVYISGLRIDGFSIRCEIADCNWVEFATFLSPQHAPASFGFTQPDAAAFGDWWEFEYLKLNFCGPGCCGGQYEFGITVYFHNQQGDVDTLFALSRLLSTVSVPVMQNLNVTASIVNDLVNGVHSLSFGWVFTF